MEKLTRRRFKTFRWPGDIGRHEDEMEDFKEMVAKLLEDARRLQQIEPNAGTQARIQEAENLLARETTHD
ncbi:hypothetical protein DUQ81_03590 [Salmonella enterica subsp. diarizonae]|nr:hypothetical protein [Salmonella enterica subsp. diarizonae]EDQ1112084.1 hypothetical protein [Salmonella enterica subsp. diarizonae]